MKDGMIIRPSAPEMPRRMVDIYIVDPDLNLPKEHALLFDAKSVLTDETDLELIQHLDTDKMLKDHNDLRANTVDREATRLSEKVVYLRSDLGMKDLRVVITTLARFDQ